jgi:cobalamin biosynthesis Mg chelatase CobN
VSPSKPAAASALKGKPPTIAANLPSPQKAVAKLNRAAKKAANRAARRAERKALAQQNNRPAIKAAEERAKKNEQRAKENEERAVKNAEVQAKKVAIEKAPAIRPGFLMLLGPIALALAVACWLAWVFWR